MNKKSLLIVLSILLMAAALTDCVGKPAEAAPKAVEAYLQALVEEDADRLANLSCAEWEEQATLELDSFMGVSARLEGLSCQQTGTEGDTAQVVCQGDIVATYNNEDRQIPLNSRTYEVVKEGGEWRVCGTR